MNTGLRTTITQLCATACLLAAAGCGNGSSGGSSVSQGEKVYVFNIGRRFEYDLMIAVRGRSCYAYRSEWNRDSVQHYVVPSLDDSLIAEVSSWVEKRGNTSPPWIPDTAIMSRRIIIPGQGIVDIQFFEWDDSVEAFRSRVKEAILRDEYKTAGMPDWISGDATLKELFTFPRRVQDAD
jgi:hypothetical protein